MLQNLLSFVLVSKFWNLEDSSLLDNHLKNFGLTTQVLVDLDQNDLIELLRKLHLDFIQQEQFADFLIAFSKENPFDLTEKAIAIYEQVQSDSKTFWFGIFNKIALAKANL